MTRTSVISVGAFGQSEAALREAIAKVPLNVKDMAPVIFWDASGRYEIFLIVTQANHGMVDGIMTDAAHDYKVRLEGWFLAHKLKNVSLPT